MSEEVAFEIDGRKYPYPGLVGLNVRECRIWYQETGVVYESIWLDSISVRDLFLMEGFVPAMARIAYTREHPETVDDEVKAVIDRQSRMSLFATIAQAFKPDEPPSEEGKAPDGDAGSSSSPTSSEQPSKPNGENSKHATSGNGSTPSSDQPESQPEATGDGRSGTPSTSLPPRRVI